MSKKASIRMKFVLFVSIMLLILGILIIAGSVFLYLSLDKALNDLEPVVNSYLTSGISTIENARNLITAVQPSLTSSSQMTGGAASTLMSIGSTMTTFGNALGFSILTWRPLASLADPIINVGSQIQSVGSQLQTMSTSLSSTNTQLENIKESLGSVEANLENTQTLLPSYFNQAHQTVLLVTSLFGFVGLSISLGGGSILRLRKEINKISDSLGRDELK
jgi:hypothetical protein